jgi:hypothetical protein
MARKEEVESMDDEEVEWKARWNPAAASDKQKLDSKKWKIVIRKKSVMVFLRPASHRISRRVFFRGEPDRSTPDVNDQQ